MKTIFLAGLLLLSSCNSYPIYSKGDKALIGNTTVVSILREPTIAYNGQYYYQVIFFPSGVIYYVYENQMRKWN